MNTVYGLLASVMFVWGVPIESVGNENSADERAVTQLFVCKRTEHPKYYVGYDCLAYGQATSTRNACWAGMALAEEDMPEYRDRHCMTVWRSDLERLPLAR